MKFLSLIAIAVLLLSACGKENTVQKMTELEALSVLNDGPVNTSQAGRNGWFSKKSSSTEGQGKYNKIFQSISILVSSGDLSFKRDHLNALAAVLNVFAEGNTSSSMMLAFSFMTKWNGREAKTNLENAVQMLTQAFPSIQTMAPQSLPTLKAILTLLPSVLVFFH